jgi:hypothetical protein
MKSSLAAVKSSYEQGVCVNGTTSGLFLSSNPPADTGRWAEPPHLQ